MINILTDRISLLLNSKLFENFVSLLSIQGFNYLLPLITIPYLIRTLGVESFGILVMVQSIIAYLKVVLIYGFNLTAVDEISKNKEKSDLVNHISSSIILTKLFLFAIASIATLLAVLILFRDNNYLFLVSLGLLELLGAVIYLDWYLQGIQEMKYLAIMEFIAKVLFTCLIFILVNDPGDLPIAVFSQAFGYFFAGLFSFIISTRFYNLKFKIVGFKNIINQLREGFVVFISQAMVPLYTSMNIVFLGIFATATQLGNFGSAYRLFEAIRGLKKPFNRTLFPHLSQKYSDNNANYQHRVKYSIVVLVIIFFTLSVICFYFSETIMGLLMGDKVNESAIRIFRILSVAILFGPFGNFFTQLLIIEGHKKVILLIVFFTVVFNLLLVFTILPTHKEYGLAYIVLAISIFVPLANGVFRIRNIKVSNA